MDGFWKNWIRIWNAADALGSLEMQLLADIAERLKMGQAAYGPLSIGKKDWKKELYEELLDGIVYAGMQVIENRALRSQEHVSCQAHDTRKTKTRKKAQAEKRNVRTSGK